MNKENSKLLIYILVVLLAIIFIIFMLVKPVPQDTNHIINNTKTEEKTMTQDTNTNKDTDTDEKITRVAKDGDTLIMNYTGRLTDGTVFDSNVDPKFRHVEPFEFVLGAGQVIQGWDEGLVGMKIGEKKTLNIPPEKAYGDRATGSIPANSTLIFDVELVGIK